MPPPAPLFLFRPRTFPATMLRPSFPSAGVGQCSGSLWPGETPEGVTRNTLQYGLTLIEPIWGRYLFIGTLATIPADRADSGSSFMAGISKGNYSLPTTLLRTVYLSERGANLDANGQQMQTCKTVKCFVASLPLLVVELNATLSMDMTFTIDTCSFF